MKVAGGAAIYETIISCRAPLGIAASRSQVPKIGSRAGMMPRRQALPSRLRYLAGSAVEHCVVTASANVAGPLLVIALRLGDGRRRIS